MATRKNLTIKDEIAGSRFTLGNGSPNLDRLFQSDLPLLERMRIGPSTKHCIGHVFLTVLQLLKKCSLSQHPSVTLISGSVGSYYTFDSRKHDSCVKFIRVMCDGDCRPSCCLFFPFVSCVCTKPNRVPPQNSSIFHRRATTKGQPVAPSCTPGGGLLPYLT